MKTKRLLAALLAVVVGTMGAEAQEVTVRLMDGSEFQAGLRGYVNGNLIRLHGMTGPDGTTVDRTAYMAVSGVDRLIFEDGCEMVFGGEKLSLQGIRNMPELKRWGDMLTVEGKYKLTQPEIRTLLGDDLYKKYKANKHWMTAGSVCTVAGSILILPLIIEPFIKKVSSPMPWEESTTDYHLLEDLVPGWDGSVGGFFTSPYGITSAILFTGGVTCILIANSNLKKLVNGYNLSLSQSGIGLSYHF